MQPATSSTGEDVAMLLLLWEQGLARTDTERADALLAAVDDSPPHRTLGERTLRLLNLHARLFGQHLDLLSRCPSCGARSQFTADCAELAATMTPAEPAALHHLRFDDLAISFRLPTSADLTAASAEPSEEAFARRLVAGCVRACSRGGQAIPPSEWPDAAFDAIANRIEALDPGASVSFALRCPQCAAAWRAPLDCGQLLWQKVQTAAERLLLDVDALARAYGWTEAEVLSLSPVRRAAYVQMITT